MKALVDAQLPRRLAYALRGLGWDAIHTLDLPLGNRTPDEVIARIADVEDRFVITKDADFVHSHLLRGKPRRLLLVTVGNVSNDALIRLFDGYASEIQALAEAEDRITVSPLGVEAGLPLL